MSEEVFAYYLNLMNNTTKYTPDLAEQEVFGYDEQKLQTFYILINCYRIFQLKGLKEPKFQKTNTSYKLFGDSLQIIYNRQQNLTEQMLTKGIKDVLFIQGKEFKKSTKIEGYNIQYILKNQMIIPITNQQIRSYTIYDRFDIYDGIEMDDKCPIILYNDPLVIQLGMKIGQVLKIETIIPEGDKLPQIEFSYRKVATHQVKTQEVQDEDQEIVDDTENIEMDVQ